MTLLYTKFLFCGFQGKKAPKYPQIAGFPISILVVGGALPLQLEWAPGVGDRGSNYWLVLGGAVISAHFNMAPTTALHTLMSLSLIFTKKKEETPVKPKHKYVLSGYWGVL